MQLKIKSLQQRLIIFLLLPVAIFSGARARGYLYIRAASLRNGRRPPFCA